MCFLTFHVNARKGIDKSSIKEVPSALTIVMYRSLYKVIVDVNNFGNESFLYEPVD